MVCTVYETPIDKQNEDSVSNRISFIFNTEVTDLNPNRDADGVSYIVDSLDNAKPRPKVYGVLSKLCVVLWFALAAAVIYFANKFA